MAENGAVAAGRVRASPPKWYQQLLSSSFSKQVSIVSPKRCANRYHLLRLCNHLRIDRKSMATADLDEIDHEICRPEHQVAWHHRHRCERERLIR